MKKTPLTERHEALGAKMTDFAGFAMPVSYTGIKEEHRAVRESVGIFDVSHMGEFIVRGKEALDFVQKVTSNDATRLKIGDAQYSCIPNTDGGIVDDCLVYRLPETYCSEGEQAFMLVVNAANIEKDWDWIKQYQEEFDTELIDISDKTGLLAIQGPKAAEAIQMLTTVDLHGMKYYTFEKGEFAGVNNVLISATGYTGSGGFELYVDADKVGQIWDAIFVSAKEGAGLDVTPAGLGARDTLRLEMGLCLYGNDIDDTTSPLEAGLGWITKLKKGDFVGRDAIVELKEKGIERKLVGFEVQDRRVPRQGYSIEDANGNVIGNVTSGTLAPSLDKPVGMGYVQKEFSEIGTEIFIVTGRKKLTAHVAKRPFYKK